MVGPTGCGKTSLVRSVIDTKIIQPIPAQILWLYAEDQPLYKSLGQNVCFFKGIPEDLETHFDGKQPCLVVIDDLMTKLHSDERLTRLFRVGSHH